jgi:isopenicillin N synthase-like dioxygenase
MAAVENPPISAGHESSLSAALEAQEYLQSRLTATSETTSFRSIPIIDLTKSFSASLTDRQEVARQINDACTTVGFFYITDHGIPEEICSNVLNLAHRFFHELPQSSKEAIHMKNSNHFRGYEPAAFSSVNDFTSKETKEAFNWGYESGLDPTGGDGKYVELDGSSEGAVNQWPPESELPGFYKRIAQYYGEVCSAFAIRQLGSDLKIGSATFEASLPSLRPLTRPSRKLLRNSHDTPRWNSKADQIPA